MKKFGLFMAFTAIMALGFASCDDGKPHCWEVKTTMTIPLLGTETATAYVWLTKDELDAKIKESKEEAKKVGIDVKISTKKVNKSETDCAAANVTEG